MDGRHLLLILALLFRKLGSPVSIEEAVEFLSFRLRLGTPTNIRRLLTLATEKEFISREGDKIRAEFLFDRQNIPLNLVAEIRGEISLNSDIEPMR